MHHLLSPILDAFLNDNLSPEDIADQHNISIREVLDLLLSGEAATIFRRLERAEQLRQSVLAARARSKAFATLDYLTLFDRQAKHADCEIRRRVSEVILRQTRPEPPATKPDRRTPSSPRTTGQIPDLVRLRAARVAAEHSGTQQLDAQPDHRGQSLSVSATPRAAIAFPHPSPLFQSPSQRNHPSHPAPTPSRMNSVSSIALAASDDG